MGVLALPRTSRGALAKWLPPISEPLSLLWDVTPANRGCRAVSSEGAPGARKALCVTL